MNVMDKLNDFNTIQEGWHFGEGERLSYDVYSWGII